MSDNFSLKPTSVAHGAAIEQLLDVVFGPGRKARMAERLREDAVPIGDLSFVAFAGEILIGAVSCWPIFIGAREAVLLGPLVVASDWQGKGVGRKLLAKVTQSKDKPVLLIGDVRYYASSGFGAAPKGLIFPAPVNPERVLVKMPDGEKLSLSGTVRAR